MADFVMPPDEGVDQVKAAAPLTGTDFVMPTDPNPVALVNARDAASGNPDEYAKAKKIAERLALPLPVVQSDLPSFDSEQKVADVQARMARDPFYAQQMRDPNFAKLSSGDAGVPGAVKDVVAFPWKATQAVAGGLYQLGAGAYGVGAAAADIGSQLITKPLTGTILPEDIFGKIGASLRAQSNAASTYGKRVSDVGPDAGIIRQSIASGFESVGSNLPMLITALFTGNLPVALTIMSASTGGQSYVKGKEAGLTTMQATKYGLADAGFEYLTEIFPLTRLIGEMKAGAPFIKAFMHNQVAEQIGEQSATVLQDFNEWATLHPEQPFSAYLEARPVAALQTAIATAIGSGGQVALMHVAAKAADMQTLNTSKDAAALQALLDYSNQSALLKRDVPTFTQFVNDAAAQGPVDSVYIDATTFAQAAQQAGVDLKTAMPETAAALDEAVATKSDVRIPLGEFAANSTLFQPEIVQHLKTDPNGATLLQTQDKAWIEATQQATEKALAQMEFTSATKQSSDVVKGELKAQLDAANRFTPEVNDAYAGFMAAFYTTQAARLGITPEQMYVKYPLRVQSQNFEGANVLTQMPAEPIINVGLNVNDGSKIAASDVVDALRAIGVDVKEQTVHQSNTEPTLVATLSRPLTPTEAHDLSAALKQDAIVQYANGNGALHGPNAAAWGDYNPDFFLLHDGVPASGSTIEHRIGELQASGQMAKFAQSGRVKNVTPAVGKLLKNLTPNERRKVTDGLAARIIEHLGKLPAADEMAAVAWAGRAKRGWYAESARAISEVFGWDAPHFAALLAALSPQTSVESNLGNALRTWAAWDAAGRPRDRATIIAILAKNVEGSGTESSVLNAWINNSVHALQDIDSLTSRPLSGPKVNSFYLNLLGNVNELTLDTWMANYALIDQKLFGGVGMKEHLRDPGKGTMYLAYNSRVREAAARLSKYTGETWTPAEVQETVWSWAKTLYEKAQSAGETRTAKQIVLDDALTNELLTSTPDFANLFHDPRYASILQDAGYGQQLDELAASRRDNARQPGEDDAGGSTGEATPFDRTTQKRHEARAATRLDKLAVKGVEGTFKQSALRLPEYGQNVPGSISVVGVHFSKEARPMLLSSKMGTGMAGAEQARAPMQRINFYVNQGTGIHPESDVGAVPHAVRLNGLYDASADRLNLFKTGDANTQEAAVVSHGFSGYYSRDFANGQGAAVLLGQNAVQAQVLDSTKAITEVPPPRDATPERLLAEALVEVKGLPSGQMSGPEWISTLRKAAPQIADLIPEGALAALEAHTDLMYRDEVARTFYQPTEAAPRGQISFGTNLQATPSVLTLLANADLSTFLHESGHFYLEVLRDMAAQPDAPPEVVADFAKTLAWFGVKDATAWDAMSLEAKRPFHEQFARGFEAYLFEGAAPSLELQTAFQRFRAWMVNVYQQLKTLNVSLTDEVRGVFDRLVATNEEILQAETARAFAPLYETKPDGMTDAEWGDYHVLGGEATQTAVDMLQTRSLRDMQYASNAKTAALKRLQQQAAALRKGVRAEVTAEVSAEPIYQVMRFLKTGVYEGENAGTYTTHRLDIATLNEMYPEDMADRPPILNLANMRGVDGIAPDVVAQMFGYGSGDVLVRELLNTEPMQGKIDGLTDQRMLERFGDLADPASMEKAANAAVHNEVRAKFIATELRTLDKAAGNKVTLMAMAREFAATLIARKKIRTIRPAIYNAAADKAAKNADTAFRKDDVATAAGEKRNQLVNTYASRYASDALDEVQKSVAYLKRVGESKSVDPEYRSQINALLERFDLRKVSGPEAARRQSLVQWMESQREKGFEPAIDPALENEALRKPYQDLTLEEFRGLVDSIKNIEHLGRLKSKLLMLADQRAFAVVVKDVSDSIRHYAKRTLPRETEAQMSARKQILAMHTKMSSFMRQLDGWLDNGIMQRLFVHSSNGAGAVEARMHEEATVQLMKLFEPLLANESAKQKAGRVVTPFGLYHGYMGEKTFIPEINESLSREARIMVALNVGNEGNLQRLMDGDNWTDKQVQAVVDTLTKQEMDFVQSVWDMLGAYRPAVGAQQKRLTGVEPTWIEPRQVVTKHGVYPGGYLPAKYNGALSTRSLSDEAAANLTDALRATRGSAAARASFTKERAAKVVNRPLRKDFGVITQHITEVTHRLAWQEWLVDVNRILRATPVDQAIREHYGPEMLSSIRENIEAIAAGNVGAQNALERGVNYLRTGATIAGLGWRLTTSLLQPIGLTQSMVRIGPKWIGKGLVEFLGDAAHMENAMTKISAKSETMRLRAKTMQREISEIQDTVKGEGGPIKASFFYLIQKMQLVADIPTWLGAYQKALATSGLQDPAALEANAVAQADQAVLDAQGAGQVKDLPAVLRGSPYLKLWTNFASFFIGTTFQLTRESVGRTNFSSPGSVLMLAADFVLLYSLPAALGTLMKYALSDDDDENKLIRNLLSDQLSYMLGTMVGLRELGSMTRAAVGLPGDYGGPAGGRILGEITKLAKQVQQGEADEAFWKALNGASGVIFHYPAGQINSTADGIAAMAQGKTVNPGVLAVGSSKK